MSAVRIGGNGEKGDAWEGSTLIMKSGSIITDDDFGKREGGVAAVWSQGGEIKIENGASIEGIDGRAIFSEDGGLAEIHGAITDITSNEYMMRDPSKAGTDLGGGGMTGFGGMAIAAVGNSEITIADGGKISNIKSHDSNGGDIAVWLAGARTSFVMESGSAIEDVNDISLIDTNEATVRIQGEIKDCNLKGIMVRMRGGSKCTFELMEGGKITNCSTEDAALIYKNGGIPEIIISGKINNIVANDVIFISPNNNMKNGTCTITETGEISDITGEGIVLSDYTKLFVEGKISECSSYAINYEGKFGADDGSLVEIRNGSCIEGNNNGKAQIKASFNSITSKDSVQYVKIDEGTIIGNKTIDLPYGDLILDDDYKNIQLGKASSEAKEKIENSIASDWTALGYSALWIKPSTSEYHFMLERPYSAGKTGLFAAYIPLKEDGTPQENAELRLTEVENTDPVDITLSGLEPGTSYALMLVNNATYTISPDDITIYTGGGQGTEISETGFPEFTLFNAIDFDDINSFTINDTAVDISNEDAAMERLKDQFTVTYRNIDGTPIPDDTVAGEYIADIELKDPDTNIALNNNEIEIEDGELIIRYINDIEEAQAGTNTHELLEDEPGAPVENTVAIANESPILPQLLKTEFYTNDDESRKVDPAGIQLLDDSLLLEDDNDNRQDLMEQKAIDEILGEPDDPEKGYTFDFHYLDLVDAHNGNAWVSASYGTTIYLPYPDGLTYDAGAIRDSEGGEVNLSILHYKDLHREYGISGQAQVEEAINNCEIEETGFEATPNGIKFETERAGFSPFALVWEAAQADITINYLDKDSGETIADAVTVSRAVGRPYDVNSEVNLEIAGYTLDYIEGVTKGDALPESGTVINVYYTKNAVSDPDTPHHSSGGGSSSGGSYTVGINGNWVHVDPADINAPLSTAVPEGATPVTNPEWHQWKFILNNGTMIFNQWAYIRNPYAVNGQPSEGWFSFDENGIMNYGWYLDVNTGNWYYLHRESDGMLGTMETGWHYDGQDGRWYYLDPDGGEMLLGWQQIGGSWYYFNPMAPAVTWNYDEATGGWTYNGSDSRPYGSMYINETTPDGYTVDENGAWRN